MRIAGRRCNQLGWGLLLIAAGMLPGCGGVGKASSTTSQPTQVTVTLTQVAGGFTSPVGLQAANDGSGRLFVLEQPGTIRIIQNGAVMSSPFLDISNKIILGDEEGLLGFAFHPNFTQNRQFYVHYDRSLNGRVQSVIAEYLVSATDPNHADPNSERIILLVDQPFSPHHKGGQLAFGPDNFLYIALGDGDNEGDPLGNGQDRQTMLGKILRIDVGASDPGKNYRVPPDNPFVSGGGLPEIWASGLRNPWRFSFDTATGRLFAGDVGQNRFEEVDIIQRGGNFGWNTMEGAHCFNPPVNCNTAGLIFPIAEYDHSEGDAIIGGFVYHGMSIPSLQQAYIFGDLGTGKIWELTGNPPGTFTRTLLLTSTRTISSFGQDAAGEIYVVDYGNGVILRLAAQ